MTAFINEAYTDFSQPENAAAMRAAFGKVRSELGREYELAIAGERRKTAAKLESLNPSRPSELVGIHQKGSEQDARDAVEAAYAYFPEWSQTPTAQRAELLLRIAALLRERKLEFDAWLVIEAGKTWAEADADVSEAIDFCGYYARQALKLANPEPAAGRGDHHSTVEFSAGHSGRHDGGGVGHGQHGGDQALERHADYRRQVC
jgi:1-pyrroline-5-carboxylate dehydrogenase